MYKHRLANVDDLERVLEMGAQFHKEYVEPFWDISFDTDSAALKSLALIDDGLLVVTEHVETAEQEQGEIVGMVAAEYIRYAFNQHLKMFKEVVFWLDPPHRGKALALEMMAVLGIGGVADDCQFAAMVALQHSPEHVEGMYKALGYEPFERVWIKKLPKEE